jgi:murein DD-endopeptidase MepM/ murein hydrolase activator NlpD
MKNNHLALRFIIPAIILGFILAAAMGGYLYKRYFAPRLNRPARYARLLEWFNNPVAHPDWANKAGTQCGEAPFLFPTDGYIGFIWDDSFRIGHRHQGIDIFGGQDNNQTPVVAAAAGYLTRLGDWKSTVIIRVPDDPLEPGRQIWTYYTHMADPQGNSFIAAEFPPGTLEKYVEAGTVLGKQGNYSGTRDNPTGVHLHFSIVLDNGQGSFRNELEITNTLDPSPYFGLPLNANLNDSDIPICTQSVQRSLLKQSQRRRMDE